MNHHTTKIQALHARTFAIGMVGGVGTGAVGNQFFVRILVFIAMIQFFVQITLSGKMFRVMCIYLEYGTKEKDVMDLSNIVTGPLYQRLVQVIWIMNT